MVCTMAVGDSSAGVFVGAERQAIVDRLLDAFVAVERGEGSRISMIVSPPGWGKTRIVQEFYRRLASGQRLPAYWPAEMIEDAAPDDIRGLSRTRKVVYAAEMTVSGQARMDWMWWGVSCYTRADGRLGQAMFDDATQLYAHAPALMVPPLAGATGRAFDLGSNLIGVLGLLGLAVAPPIGAGVTLVGAARTGWSNLELPARLKRWLSERRADGDRSVDATDTGHRQRDLDQLVDGLARVTSARPMVVVVDDAHFGDDGLVQVIDGLLEHDDGRVLVIATAWPSHLDRNDTALPFGVWAADFARWRSRRFDRFDLTELSRSEVARLVAAELHEASDHVERIHALYGANLLAIRAVLRLPRTRRAATEGSLDSEAIERLPRDIEGIFAEHWTGLPQDVQIVLALAAQGNRTRYLPDVIAAACNARGLVEDAQRHLAEAVYPYAWARAIDDTLHAFIEPVLQHVALGRGPELLDPKDIEALHTAMIQAALGDTGKLSPIALETALRQHIALVEAGTAPASADAARSATTLALLSAERHGYTEAIRLAEASLGWDDADQEAAVVLRIRIADWVGMSGDVSGAINAYGRLLIDMGLVFGHDHQATLATRRNFANWVGWNGQVSAAVHAYENLVDDLRRVLGAEHPDTLTARFNLAYWEYTNRWGDLDGDLYEVLFEQVQGVHGPDDTLTLFIRSLMVAGLVEAGRTDDARVAYRTLASDCESILGAEHWLTLEVRDRRDDLPE